MVKTWTKKSCTSCYLPSQAMIDEFDLDQDGEINAHEFEQIMLDEP